MYLYQWLYILATTFLRCMYGRDIHITPTITQSNSHLPMNSQTVKLCIDSSLQLEQLTHDYTCISHSHISLHIQFYS